MYNSIFNMMQNSKTINYMAIDRSSSKLLALSIKMKTRSTSYMKEDQKMLLFATLERSPMILLQAKNWKKRMSLSGVNIHKIKQIQHGGQSLAAL